MKAFVTGATGLLGNNLVRQLLEKNYEVKALVRLLLKLGVIDAERKEFWRFFIQAIRKHHDRMTESLRLAAMGYHFRKLNELYDTE